MAEHEHDEAMRRLVDAMREDVLSREETDRIALLLGPLLGPPGGSPGGDGGTASAPEPHSDVGGGSPSGTDVPLATQDADLLLRAGAELGTTGSGLEAAAASKGTAVLVGKSASWKLAAAIVLGGSVAVGVPALVETLSSAPPADRARPVPPRRAPPVAIETHLEAHAPLEDPERAAPLPEDAPPAVVSPPRQSADRRAARLSPPNLRPASNDPAPTSVEAPVRLEHQLLAEARAVLGVDPERALELAESHRTQFPRGVLSPEREIIAIDALAVLGQLEVARARATRFARAYPSSYHVTRLRDRGLID